MSHLLYLSTGCRHGRHDYCQKPQSGATGLTKIPAQCKFCGRKCICFCHKGGLRGRLFRLWSRA